ncbi:hypothetical protein, partial [Citrobacter portucalensis]|uniref:hypothetical protein n=1 Tax=Citrobacter portucalensis TaxID=1639133 RepID=UPI0022446B66
MSKDFQCPPQLRIDYAVADIHFRKRSFGRGGGSGLTMIEDLIMGAINSAPIYLNLWHRRPVNVWCAVGFYR